MCCTFLSFFAKICAETVKQSLQGCLDCHDLELKATDQTAVIDAFGVKAYWETKNILKGHQKEKHESLKKWKEEK